VFHLDDFFDRYPGEKFESAHVPFVQVDGAEEMDLSFVDAILPAHAPSLPMHRRRSSTATSYHIPQQSPPQPTLKVEHPYQPISPDPTLGLPTPQSYTSIPPQQQTMGDVYSFDTSSQTPQTLDAQGFLGTFEPAGNMFDFAQDQSGWGDTAGGSISYAPTQQPVVEQERDPLLNMLAEMAERDEVSGSGGGAGATAGRAGTAGGGVDVWMGG